MSLEMRYFVIRPAGIDAHAEASRAAMKAYALYMKSAGDPLSIANDLFAWVNSEETKADTQRQKVAAIRQFQDDLDTEDD